LEAQQVLPQGAVRAFDSAARLASARTEDDLKRAARELVLPLPPWIDHWVADVRREVISDQNPVTVRGEAHVKGQWNAMPDILSLRLRADLSYLQITRDDRRVAVGAGTSTTY
jgi:hypothetical protein